MKDVGTTNEGSHLVEMNRDEHREFTKLQEAVTGNTQFDYFRYEPDKLIEFDFSNVFHVIHVFYLAQFKVNDFQVLLDEIKSKLVGDIQCPK